MAYTSVRGLTYWISQCKIIALRSKDGKQSRPPDVHVLPEHQRENIHHRKHDGLSNQHGAPEQPVDLVKVQLHHGLEDERRQRKVCDVIAETAGLRGRHDARAPRDVPEEDDGEAFEDGRVQVGEGLEGGVGGGVAVKIHCCCVWCDGWSWSLTDLKRIQGGVLLLLCLEGGAGGGGVLIHACCV